MNNLIVQQIGVIHVTQQGSWIEIHPPYREALEGLEGFSHVQVLWWFSGCDDARSRAVRLLERPYVNGPGHLGVFATRAPTRPNPLALTCAYVTDVDAQCGRIGLAWIDADDQSPVLDLKPYTPSLDRVQSPAVPCWCSRWPESVEQSGSFDWEAEFSKDML